MHRLTTNPLMLFPPFGPFTDFCSYTSDKLSFEWIAGCSCGKNKGTEKTVWEYTIIHVWWKAS